jgi:hypothetical protein
MGWKQIVVVFICFHIYCGKYSLFKLTDTHLYIYRYICKQVVLTSFAGEYYKYLYQALCSVMITIENIVTCMYVSCPPHRSIKVQH